MPIDPRPTPSSAPVATPEEFGLEEFRQLRATIRERSAARVVVSLITFVSWGTLALVLYRWDEPMVCGLIPLVVLIVGFELAFALHVGVERIGRYVAVFYEGSPQAPKWETAIAAFGRSAAAKATQTHVLLAGEFIVAAGFNLVVLVVAVQPNPYVSSLSIAMAVIHGAFIARVVLALRQAARQREADAAAFRAIARDLGR